MLLYIDTCALVPCFRAYERNASGQPVPAKLFQRARRIEKLFRRAEKGSCECVTSTWTIMELLDQCQEQEYYHRKIEEGILDVPDIYSGRWVRKLPVKDLAHIDNRVRHWLENVVQVVRVEDPKPTQALYRVMFALASKSNVAAPDCVHLANALLLGADLVLTTDTHLMDIINTALQSTDSLRRAVEEALLEATGARLISVGRAVDDIKVLTVVPE